MEQFNIFDFTRKELRIDKPIRLIELFAGYGSQAMALENLGVDFDHYLAVEFDKYAIASYNAVHGTEFPVMDICDLKGSDLKIEETDKYCYIMTYSFPCTDLSVAGKMLGMKEGSGTRSSLLWEVKRLLEETDNLPQILLMENVTQVHSQENMPHFRRWLDFLESKGYVSYWQDLNAKEYGVAQNRDRTFCISILGEYNYKFPKTIPLRYIMKDYLEDEVEEKYYVNSEKANELIKNLLDNGVIGEKTQSVRAEQSRAEQSRAEQSRAEQSRAEQSRAEQIGGLSTQTELLKESTSSKRAINLSLQNPHEIDTANCLTAEGARRSLSKKFVTASDGVVEHKPVDLSLEEPNETPISNAITARQDRGISNRKSLGGESLSTVRMNGKRIESQTNIAKTLMARDHKGFGTGFDTQNGVIEEQ